MRIIKKGSIPEIIKHTCDGYGTNFEYDERIDFLTDCCGNEYLRCPFCNKEISKKYLDKLKSFV